MRSDFAKVVTERPRSGSSNPSAKAKWYGRIVDTEDGPDYDGHTRLPVSSKQEGYHKKIGDKNFTDVLGPIEGYLRASCGRPWDDVFSELSKNLGQRTWPVRHILTQHVDVKTNTYRAIDGHVWYFDKYGPCPVSGRPDYPEFYVEPETRFLRCCTKPLPRPLGLKYLRASYRYSSNYPAAKAAGERYQDGDRWFVNIKGIWYIGEYREVPFYGVELRANEWSRTGRLREQFPEPEWPNLPTPKRRSGTLIFTKIKQANKKELKKLRELAKMSSAKNGPLR
jgi:hypothetical protein